MCLTGQVGSLKTELGKYALGSLQSVQDSHAMFFGTNHFCNSTCQITGLCIFVLGCVTGRALVLLSEDSGIGRPILLIEPQ